MGSARCFLTGWVGAWAIAVFLPSIVIAYLGIAPAGAAHGTGLARLAAISWKVADDVGPVIKLTIGGVLLLGFLGLDRAAVADARLRWALAILIGIAAMLAAIALVPLDFSRGFGAALTGSRFDATTTPLYLLGGVLAGLAFALTIDRCRRPTQ